VHFYARRKEDLHSAKRLERDRRHRQGSLTFQVLLDIALRKEMR
jgi:hypothetical protein